ncbi:MAG: response regulator [bacterium]|nr:response regulator [bacterium]
MYQEELLEQCAELTVALKENEQLLQQKSDKLQHAEQALQQKNDELGKFKRIFQSREQEIEVLRQYRSQFLSNLSHELRTPLNSVLMLSEIFYRNREKNLSDDQIELAKTIYAAGIFLAGLVNEVLDFAALDANKLIVHPGKVALEELQNSIERSFRDKIEQKELEFTIELAEDIPETMITDRERLEHVLKNCLDNALKFTPKGTINLAVHRPSDAVQLSSSHLDPSHTLAFSISDTGIGIPPEKHQQIFEAFQQADNGLSRRFEGVGLGLTVVEKLVHLLGGEIQLYSQEGKGSSFTLYLPETLGDLHAYVPSALVQTENKEVEEIEHLLEIGNIRDNRNTLNPDDFSVLIIENDPQSVKMLCACAHNSDIKYLIAGDGKAGLQLADQFRPNVIFLNAGLISGFRGWKIMERLKDDFEIRHIPIYFMSSHDILHEAVKIGAFDFLKKPFSEGLLKAVFQHIRELFSNLQRNLVIVERSGKLAQNMRNWLRGAGVRVVNPVFAAKIEPLLPDGALNCILVNFDESHEKALQFLERIEKETPSKLLPVIIYSQDALSDEQEIHIKTFQHAVILKKAYTLERVLDEISLFLYIDNRDLPDVQQKMLESLHPSQVNLQGKRLLLVDYHMRSGFTLADALDARGARTIICENIQEAEEHLLKPAGIDLILFDAVVLGENEYELLEQLRNIQQEKALPIIVMKANGVRGDRLRYLEAGASDFIAKPVTLNRLISLLRVWLY